MEICSLIVYCKPNHLKDVINRISKIAGVEVPEHSQEGKIIVVIESDEDNSVTEIIDKIQFSKDILSVMLVYQQSNV